MLHALERYAAVGAPQSDRFMFDEVVASNIDAGMSAR